MGLRDIFGRIVGSSEDRDQGYALNEKGWHAWYNSQMRQGYGTPLEFANGIAVSNPDMVIRLGSNPDEVAANYAMSERYRRRSDPSTNDPRLHNVNNTQIGLGPCIPPTSSSTRVISKNSKI